MQNELQDFATRAIDRTFTPDFAAKYRAERPQEAAREALGTIISQWCEWSGHRIAEIFVAALEDANFHTEAAEIQTWIDAGDVKGIVAANSTPTENHSTDDVKLTLWGMLY